MKTMRRALSVLSVVLGLFWLRVPASAQTCAWSVPGGGIPLGDVAALTTSDEPSGVAALTVYDDGHGAALYAGGSFTRAGGIFANHIAKWDGTQWSPLGSGMDGDVAALTVFNDGSGPALFAGGTFTTAGGVSANHIAKWNGTQWSALGSGLYGSSVNALAVFNDGTGAALYAAGQFTYAGDVLANDIAKWNGTQWSALGSGINGSGSVYALTVFDGGTGPALYAGGDFSGAGGVSAPNIARWNGTQWSALGGGLDGWVRALTVFNDGRGPALYAGGGFGINIARWDGTQWSRLGGGVNNPVVALTVFDDGSGPALYAGGWFTAARDSLESEWDVSIHHIAKWNGIHWTALGSGTNAKVYALAVFNSGTGSALYAGGDFTTAGGLGAVSMAAWNGAQWSSAGSGMTRQVVFAGGSFYFDYITKWDGTRWSALGSGMNNWVLALTVFDDGAGPALYAGGWFTTAGGTPANHVAKWDGTQWSPLGSGTDGYVYALAVFDDGTGPALYAGGDFSTAGGTPANHIAKWDGTQWSPLGSGLLYHTSYGWAYALTVFDDGTGPALYAGGYFDSAGGTPANSIAKWDGTRWRTVGTGVEGGYQFVEALTVFDDGTGPSLYAGGTFTRAGGVPANNIAQWDGRQWINLGSGTNGYVDALAVFDDGRGPALYVGGAFDSAGGTPANYIAKWDGTQGWSALGDGQNGRVLALAGFNDERGPALYAGGGFLYERMSHVAAWRCQLF